MELITLLAPDLVNLGVLLCNHEWDFSLEEFDGIDQWQVYFWFRPVFIPSTNCTCKKIYTVGLNVGAVSFVQTCNYCGNLTLSHRKWTKRLWILNGALKPRESHHSSTSLIYTVITLSTLAQQNHKVPESLTITPFSENSENSKLKLSCFRPLFFGNEETIPCISQEGIHTNQPKHHHSVYPTSDLRYPCPSFLSSTGWDLKKQVFCEGMRRDHSFDVGDVWKDFGCHVSIPRWTDVFVWYCWQCICVLWLLSWRQF